MPAKTAPKAFDFDTLTLGEVAFIEDISGQSIGSIADEQSPKGKALAAVVTVIKRRTGHPDFKFNDALEVPLSEANSLLGVSDDVEDEEPGEADASDENATA